ncbi:MAG: DUF6285 domain-containing protein [Gammaproteobacteria bacterium]|nr:DUF6285 domain-containing protein [Gammaproteobacteria bacterium]
MNNRPLGAELLNTARETLKGLVNDLPREKQYEALMVLNAMAIAAREMTNADEANLQLEGLKKLYETDEHDESSLLELSRRLARDIRQQKFDNDSEAYTFLIETATRKLRVSNPKYLKG